MVNTKVVNWNSAYKCPNMQDILLHNQYFFYKTFNRVHDVFSAEVELVFQFTNTFLLFLCWTHISQIGSDVAINE